MSPEALLREGVERGLYTGGCLGLLHRDGRRTLACAGTLGDAAATPVGPDHRFDLASLTKGLATALCAARLVAEGELRWETPACALLPALKRGRHREITVEHLLAHTAGLPAWAPLYRTPPDSEAAAAAGGPPPAAWRPRLLAAVEAQELEARPGERFRYSDLGYLLLGEIVARAATAPLADCTAAWVAEPLGIGAELGFRPARPGAPGWEGCAATERCPWRRRRLQ
ncbi:MAG: class A beta-lactamase-related serine hydrolase, partial [Nitrospirae bacterium]